MDPVDWKVVTEKLSQLDIWSGESLESSSIAAVRGHSQTTFTRRGR